MTETEKYVVNALSQLSIGNDGDATYHPLYKAWHSYNSEPKQLNQIQDYARYGMGLMVFLSYGTVTNIDYRQQLTSIAYLFLSKAIKDSPNINCYKNRLLLMISNHEAFEYTVSSVVNKDTSFMMMRYSPFKARDAIYKMEFADLSSSPSLLSIDMFSNKYRDLKTNIASNFFGSNQTETSIIAKGKELHDEVLAYLENKVIVNRDISF